MKLPEEYWSRVERDPLALTGQAQGTWPHRFKEDLNLVGETVLKGQRSRVLVWRGQSNADNGLSSSLFRKALFAHSMSELSERRLFNLEADIVSYARKAGLGRGMSNVQLLHALQHYQIPTRLIDVSRGPISALWFACSDRARKDGRLFLFAVPQSSIRTDDPNLQMLPWAGIKLANWTNKVLLLDVIPSNPRMASQDGAFLVGGLARNYAGQQRLTKDKQGKPRYVPAEQIHEISEIFVKFPLEITLNRVRGWKADETYGVTWRIPYSQKQYVLEVLTRLGITNETMYPNFEKAKDGLESTLRLA